MVKEVNSLETAIEKAEAPSIDISGAGVELADTEIYETGLDFAGGLVHVYNVTGNVGGLFRLESQAVDTSAISADASITATQGTPASVNVYFDVDQYKIENLSGGTITVKSFFLA